MSDVPMSNARTSDAPRGDGTASSAQTGHASRGDTSGSDTPKGDDAVNGAITPDEAEATQASSMGPPLVRATELTRIFDVSAPLLARLLRGESRQYLQAVRNIDFEIRAGETFALVGESGCGKSTVAKLVVGLQQPSSGRIEFAGENLAGRSRKEMAPLRRRLQMIFQDPYASLNPRWRVRQIIAEPIRAFKLIDGDDAINARVDELLDQVKLTPADGSKFPHEFSGGQRQRISIARALASEPEFLVCDEPTSALDVSVQAQVLNLMKDLQDELGLTYLFISHNLAVVSFMSDRVGVMYLGALVEVGDARSLFAQPYHPYTRMLIDTIPDISLSGVERTPPSGEVPNPISPPSGCAFHPRCPYVEDRCRTEAPSLARTERGSLVACHGIEEGRIGEHYNAYPSKTNSASDLSPTPSKESHPS